MKSHELLPMSYYCPTITTTEPNNNIRNLNNNSTNRNFTEPLPTQRNLLNLYGIQQQYLPIHVWGCYTIIQSGAHYGLTVEKRVAVVNEMIYYYEVNLVRYTPLYK